MNKPRYFVAVFGDPRPGKDAVGSGVYAPNTNHAPFPAQPGDVMVLYCTAGYSVYPMQVPGLGVVLRVDREHIEYRWVPFAQPIPKAHIPKAHLDRSLEPDDAAKLGNIRFASHWLFEVSQESFSRTVGHRATA